MDNKTNVEKGKKGFQPTTSGKNPPTAVQNAPFSTAENTSKTETDAVTVAYDRFKEVQDRRMASMVGEPKGKIADECHIPKENIAVSADAHDADYENFTNLACSMGCGRKYALVATEAEWKKYADGALIQDAFPSIGAEYREMLISGICPACFDNLFPEDDEDY